MKILLFFLMFILITSSCSQSGRRKTKSDDTVSPGGVEKIDLNSSNNKKNSSQETLPKNNSYDENMKNGDTNDSPQIEKNASVAEMFEDLQSGVFMVFAYDNEESVGQGSGFFVNSTGIGITNYHVLQGYNNYFIRTSDGEIYEIKDILKASKPEDDDYVIFQIDANGQNFNHLLIAENKSSIGDDVFVIGSPRGLENSLTRGSVSQYRENNRIQIDATIEHGSSGGPLFNMNGEVIGIISAKLRGTDAALNFAIDIHSLPYQGYVKKKNSYKIATSKNFYLPSTTFGETIAHTYYTLSYSNYDKQAEWVAYKITQNNFSNIERTNDYREDPKVKTESSELYDYKRSGYDMGHLAPAASMSHNIRSMSESFYLSNISPQEPSFNRGIWKRLEEKVRYWAYLNDSTFVVTGPVLNNPKGYIGNNKVTVPSSFYKTLLGYRDGKVRGIAFLMPNESSKKSIYLYVTSINHIEQITGIDFYQYLDSEAQRIVEANEDLKKWALK